MVHKFPDLIGLRYPIVQFNNRLASTEVNHAMFVYWPSPQSHWPANPPTKIHPSATTQKKSTNEKKAKKKTHQSALQIHPKENCKNFHLKKKVCIPNPNPLQKNHSIFLWFFQPTDEDPIRCCNTLASCRSPGLNCPRRKLGFPHLSIYSTSQPHATLLFQMMVAMCRQLPILQLFYPRAEAQKYPQHTLGPLSTRQPTFKPSLDLIHPGLFTWSTPSLSVVLATLRPPPQALAIPRGTSQHCRLDFMANFLGQSDEIPWQARAAQMAQHPVGPPDLGRQQGEAVAQSLTKKIIIRLVMDDPENQAESGACNPIERSDGGFGIELCTPAQAFMFNSHQELKLSNQQSPKSSNQSQASSSLSVSVM
ncbi:hypothetical protein VP01_2563g1 [Puccinia sorghi]|uniref:Uncharacterized protein n=1 Tax=Puccinia sorghi TaxID=27349 RepID=A0A0L6V519_9BASI|nr:hypothetical protein VP01_2563g1 [Puccinia sorghi]